MGRTTVFMVGGDTAKAALFSRLKLDEVGPRYIHFPHGQGFDDEYFRQLTAEEIRTRMKNGFPVTYWKKIRERNEALDCFVYALASLDILNPNFEKLAENIANAKEEPEPDDSDSKPISLKEVRKPPKRPLGGSNYVNSWQ